jgi:1,2-diacylglycerol 3-beta-glucosyltransferase
VSRHVGAEAAGAAQRLLWIPVAYLAVVTAAGLRQPARIPQAPASRSVVVLVPAHDEEGHVEETVQSLLATDYDPALRRVVVVADNCSDATADRARRAGAEVWERINPGRRGKGAALAWAVGRLTDEPGWETVVVVDADTRVDPGLLRALNDRMAAGAEVVQSEQRVANPADTVVSRLAEASFAVQSVLRQRGRAALGAAAKLQGNGMAFSRAVIERHEWTSDALTEDIDAWLTLLRRGVRPRFEPRARVAGLMPTTLAAARVQRARWEAGRLQLVRRHLSGGLREAAARRDLVLLEAVVSELVFPPLAILAAAIGAAGIARALATGRPGSAPAQAGVLATHALAGLVVSRASPKTYAALALAPAVVAWKVALKLELALGRGPTGWSRTPRPKNDPRARP